MRCARSSSLAGTAFGAHGEGYLRFSYASSLERIAEALERIRAVLAVEPAGALPKRGVPRSRAKR